MRRGRLVGLLALALSASAAAQGPSAEWRTLSTPHFHVHFPEDFAAFARHAAASLESAYPRVAERIGWAPAIAVDVIVKDPRAAANGAAVPWLDRPQIVLWAFPPDAESSTGRFSDWADVLSAHELAHVAHLARPGTGAFGLLARFSPAPLGPLAIGSPRWLIEGYATLIEGELTGFGRPGSAYRAMIVRQLALEGELPSYGKLSSTRGWLSASLAYLVGSAYLEWLGEREGRDRLPELWRAMGEWRGFDGAFRSIFGASPGDLYAAFVADAKARSLEAQTRLASSGLVEGELWRRLRGGTASASVSPDGKKLVARRDSSPRSSSLAVWEIEEGGTESPPRWTLPRANGYSAADPRWMPDGRRVLFARRAPAGDGVLVWDLYRWTPETGAVERVTRDSGVADADPSPDGRSAVGVRNRFGISALVVVDLATGGVAELPVSAGPDDAWVVWSHPRFSPDGRRIACLLHRGGRWRLVILPAGGGAALELPVPGEPVGEPAWSPDGARVWIAADGSGIWNLYEADPGGRPARARTRVTGGAFSPAPAPDGRSLFFLDFTARGVEVRRLDPETLGPVELEASATSAAPEGSRAAPTAAAAERPYDVWSSLTIRPLVGFSVSPSGSSVQVGVDAGDTVGRLHGFAAGSFGNAAGPRGGALAAAWRGSQLEVSGSLFSALEKPGSQNLAPRPELDQQRSGGFLALSWGRPFFWGAVSAEAGGGATRVEAFATGERFWRSLGSVLARASFRRTRDGFGFGLDAEAQGSAGTTRERFWSQASGGLRLSGLTPFARLSAEARTGASGGEPTAFDVFSIGGAPSTILSPGLDRNRIPSLALPAAVQLGERFESLRCEVEVEAVPLAVYGEWLRAWRGGGQRPPAVRVTGAEARLERLLPTEVDRRLTLRVGVGYVSSDAPRIRATRGYAALVYRP